MRLSVAKETIDDSGYRAGKDSVHCNSLGDYVQLYRDLVLGETHIDEDIANEYQHDPQDSEGQCLSVVMEVFGNVHVVQSDQGIKVLLFDLHIPQLSHLHHQLDLLLLSKRLENQKFFKVILVSFFVYFEELVLFFFYDLLFFPLIIFLISFRLMLIIIFRGINLLWYG